MNRFLLPIVVLCFLMSCSSDKGFQKEENNVKEIKKKHQVQELVKPKIIDHKKTNVSKPVEQQLLSDSVVKFSVEGIKYLKPDTVIPLLINKEMIEKFNSPESFSKCEAVWAKWSEEGRNWETATDEENEILKFCHEVREDIWDIEGAGCSWYCGGGPDQVIASSSLETQNEITYSGKNAHDLNYKNVWVEGVNGYGIGEYLEYKFKASSPRITEFKIVNGYVKSELAYRSNSRVKSLNVYYNDSLFAVLELEDVRSTQVFRIDTLGYGNRRNQELLKTLPDWELKFEIAEVYEGGKWDDVVVSEIYFDGIDVHCFAKDTEVLMADSSVKLIQDLLLGDLVMSYNQRLNQLERTEILSLASPVHSNLVQILLTNGVKVNVTKDHPFLLESGGFASVQPEKTSNDYLFEYVEKLKVGSKLKSVKGDVLIVEEIKGLQGDFKTYTIVKLQKNNTFIANGVLVGTEELRGKSSFSLVK